MRYPSRIFRPPTYRSNFHVKTHTSQDMPLKKTKKSDNDERESIFEEFCQALTCVGVSDWYQAGHWAAKAFWAVLLTFSLVITSYEIVVTIEGLIYDPPFKTTTSRSRMQGEKIPFPNVTICNYNRIKQSVLNRTKIDPKALIYMFNWFHASYDLPMSLLDENQNQMFERAWTDYVASKGGNVSIEDILETHGHDEDMFLGITHFRRMVEKFEQVTSICGRCWKPAISYCQQMPGSHMGVQMIIDPQFYDYLNDVSINAFLESGILVSFTYVDEFLIPRPVSVPIGTAAKIALKLTKYTQSESQVQLRKFKCTKADTQFSMISVGDYGIVWRKSYPDDNYVLFAERSRITDDERLSYVNVDDQADWSIKVQQVRSSDAGIYECTLSSDPVKILKQKLEVQSKPIVNIFPEKSPQILAAGSSLTLTCQAIGNPTPTITWSRAMSPPGAEKTPRSAIIPPNHSGDSENSIYTGKYRPEKLDPGASYYLSAKARNTNGYGQLGVKSFRTDKVQAAKQTENSQSSTVARDPSSGSVCNRLSTFTIATLFFVVVVINFASSNLLRLFDQLL